MFPAMMHRQGMLSYVRLFKTREGKGKERKRKKGKENLCRVVDHEARGRQRNQSAEKDLGRVSLHAVYTMSRTPYIT